MRIQIQPFRTLLKTNLQFTHFDSRRCFTLLRLRRHLEHDSRTLILRLFQTPKSISIVRMKGQELTASMGAIH